MFQKRELLSRRGVTFRRAYVTGTVIRTQVTVNYFVWKCH